MPIASAGRESDAAEFQGRVLGVVRSNELSLRTVLGSGPILLEFGIPAPAAAEYVLAHRYALQRIVGEAWR